MEGAEGVIDLTGDGDEEGDGAAEVGGKWSFAACPQLKRSVNLGRVQKFFLCSAFFILVICTFVGASVIISVLSSHFF